MTEEKLELQFERAEPSQAPAAEPAAPAPVQCTACGSRLQRYYAVNGRVACQRCRDAAVASHGRSHLPSLAAALGLGLLAAVLGAILYFAVAKITGYEIGLVSIVVGLLVGKAVKKGGGGRGGWRYQALAVLLCYLSIAASYGAFVVADLAGKAASHAGADAGPVAPSPVAPAAVAQPAPAGADATPSPEPSSPDEAPGGLALLGGLLLLLVQLPVLVGKESPMTFLLIGIALWEAWRINVGAPFEATGPYAVAERTLSNG